MGCLPRSWLGAVGPPTCLQLDGGGESRDELWADLRAGRRIKAQFQGVGAHLWLLERRNGLARGIYNRRADDDRFANEKISRRLSGA